jgi:hypothetical protein
MYCGKDDAENKKSTKLGLSSDIILILIASNFKVFLANGTLAEI